MWLVTDDYGVRMSGLKLGHTCWPIYKLDPIMLPEFPMIFTHYSYFIPMPSPIIPFIFFIILFILYFFIVAVTMRSSPQFSYLVADTWVYLMWLILILLVILSEKLYCCFHQSMFGNISLHSAILILNSSFILLVNILLFQHYSCQNL